MQKVNVGCVIRDHLSTFRGAGHGRGRSRVLLRFWLPVVAASAALSICYPLTSEAARSVVYVSLALAFALTNGLFHLLRISSSPCARGGHAERRASLVKAAHANLSFSILLAIITPMPALGYLLVAPGRRCAILFSLAIYMLATSLAGAVLAFLSRTQDLVTAELQLE